MRRNISLAVLVVLFGMVAVAPAHAEGPTKLTGRFSDSDPDYSCGFEVLYETDFTFTTWTDYDSDGNTVRYREHATRRTQTWTNPSNGRALVATGGAYQGEWNIREPDLVTYTGQAVAVTMPGEGVVFLDAGRVQFSGWAPPWEFLFVAGHHDLWFGPFNGAPSPELFCTYLAG